MVFWLKIGYQLFFKSVESFNLKNQKRLKITVEKVRIFAV